LIKIGAGLASFSSLVEKVGKKAVDAGDAVVVGELGGTAFEVVGDVARDGVVGLVLVELLYYLMKVLVVFHVVRYGEAASLFERIDKFLRAG
jgi:hypothetical protein